MLASALKGADAGDVIKLATGTYTGLSIGNLSYGSGITITSADASKPAIITDFTLANMQGVTFSRVEMATLSHPDLIAIDAGYFAFKVYKGSSDITFDHVNFHGSDDGNAANDVMGLQIRDSDNITVTNSEFHDLARALAVGQTDNIRIAGNNVHDLRSDGFDFAEVGHISITGNTFETFNPNPTDHPDAIQFWTSGTTTASHDILISGNVILKGDGDYTQGIFLRDQVGTLHYERVTIADNLIVGTGYSGIRVQGANGITISRNELVSFDGDNKTYMLIQDSDKVVSTGNKGAQIGYDNSTHVTEVGTVATTAITDHGAAAEQNWLNTHAMSADQRALLQAAADAAKAIYVAPPEVAHAGNESLVGNADGNVINAYGGNDTLAGLGGADTLVGGTGNDVYIIDNGSDLIVEKPGEGIDTVIARGEHFLEPNVENLIIETDDDKGWRGWGNELNNRITGNAGANALDGGAGNDTIDGGAGNDTITGGPGNDRLTGGAGDDVFRFAPGGGRDTITDLGASSSTHLASDGSIDAGVDPGSDGSIDPGPDLGSIFSFDPGGFDPGSLLGGVAGSGLVPDPGLDAGASGGSGRELLDISAYIKAGFAPKVTEVNHHAVISFSNGDSIAILNLHASAFGDVSKIGWLF